MNRLQPRGFTLVELLVAITVFSIMAAMAYGGLRSVLNSEHSIDQAARRLNAIQQAMTFIGRDLSQLSGRGIRDQFGDRQPPLRSQPRLLKTAIELTRGGWSNPAGQMRSTLQRVGYAVEERQLIRYSWPVLDRAPDTQPLRFPLLDKVQSLQLRFMDDKHAWHEEWPLATGGAAAPESLPRAVEFTLDLADLGVVRRLMVIDAMVIVTAPPTTGATP